MQIRFWALGAAFFVAACEPQVPDSAAGVGFGDYDSYQQSREAALQGTTAPPSGPAVSPETPGTLTIDPNAPVTTASTAQVVPGGNTAISDEQSFDAVSSRESIASDAERLEANRAAYVTIAPTALPTRPSDGRPNIVAYALATNNPVGTSLYKRGSSSQASFDRACAKFPSSDLAQEEFLARGGPERDRLGVDPDGDGYACYWDPSPFRTARGG